MGFDYLKKLLYQNKCNVDGVAYTQFSMRMMLLLLNEIYCNKIDPISASVYCAEYKLALMSRRT